MKVKEDMEIQISEEVFGVQKWECEVVSNYNVASFIKEFVVRLPDGENLEFEAKLTGRRDKSSHITKED